MELWEEILHYKNLLETAISQLRKRGRVLAKAEYDYRVMLSKRLMQYRSEGMPVTHLADIARGDEDVAMLRLKRDEAEVLYDSCKEAINVYKIHIRILENQFQREWGGVKNEC